MSLGGGGVHFHVVKFLTGRPKDHVINCLIFGPVLISYRTKAEMFYRLLVTLRSLLHLLLAPPAEWQRSFSNADSSVVVVNFSLKWLISQIWPDNFLAWSFLWKVLMYCKNMDLV